MQKRIIKLLGVNLGEKIFVTLSYAQISSKWHLKNDSSKKKKDKLESIKTLKKICCLKNTVTRMNREDTD